MPAISLHRKKLIQLILCFLFGMFMITLFQTSQISTQIYHFFHPKDGIQCYRILSDSLPDISQANPRKGKSIFFHETSCNSFYNGKISITARQACAVESAAKMNPNCDIYLLYASPGVFQFEDTESDRILKALMSYENVKIFHLDFKKYTENTPVQRLYQSGVLDESKYAQSHASDVLRYLTLWKYGGIYLDLDVIVTRSLELLEPNFAGSESDDNVAAGVLSFTPTGIGHDLAKACLGDLRYNFDGSAWGHNGPGVITRLLTSICGVDKAKDMINEDCKGFTVYPTDTFYAVPWWNWTMYFDEKYTDAVLNSSKNSYAVHVWNKHSFNSKIPVMSQIPYLLFAKEYCPKVIDQCDEYF